MFKAMDTDNSGAITFDELKAGLRRYGSTMKDAEIRDLMDAVCTLFMLKKKFSSTWLEIQINCSVFPRLFQAAIQFHFLL